MIFLSDYRNIYGLADKSVFWCHINVMICLRIHMEFKFSLLNSDISEYWCFYGAAFKYEWKMWMLAGVQQKPAISCFCPRLASILLLPSLAPPRHAGTFASVETLLFSGSSLTVAENRQSVRRASRKSHFSAGSWFLVFNFYFSQRVAERKVDVWVWGSLS